MVIRTIKYEDFNGNKKEKVAYFNITEVALAKVGNELNEIIAKLQNTKNPDLIADMLSRIILMSYGEKSEDGETFNQSKEVKEKFEYSAAFPALFMELAQDEEEFNKFVKGVIPKSLAGKLTELTTV